MAYPTFVGLLFFLTPTLTNPNQPTNPNPVTCVTLARHDFDRLERALLRAAEKSERHREMDSIE